MSQYAGNDYNSNTSPITQGTLTTAHSAGLIVAGCLFALVAIRLGYRDISIGRVTGGLVKG